MRLDVGDAAPQRDEEGHQGEAGEQEQDAVARWPACSLCPVYRAVQMPSDALSAGGLLATRLAMKKTT